MGRKNPKDEIAARREAARDSLPARLLRTGAVVALFAALGIAVGMGYFSAPITPPPPAIPEGAPGEGDPGFAPAMLGAMLTERRPDGQEWQSMLLTGRYNSDLDGTVHMSLYQEPANVLLARFESEARKSGWTDLQGAPRRDGKLELYHEDGRLRIIAVDEHSGDLRSVTIFTGKLARR